MSHTEFKIQVQKIDDLSVTVEKPAPDEIKTVTMPDVHVMIAGNVGPPGPQGPEGQWVALTQAEYDALSPPDPETLYVIIQ